MTLLQLVISNIWRRWRERQAAKIDGTFVRDFERMRRADVIHSPSSGSSSTKTPALIGQYRNLRVVRSAHPLPRLRTVG